MPTDLRIVVPNRPGTLLKVCEAVADAGINIEGFCGDIRPGERWGFIHILVEDPDGARRALESIGVEVLQEHDTELLDLEDRPGALVEAVRAYREAERNVEVIYMAGHSRIVVGTEDMRREIPGVKTKDARY